MPDDPADLRERVRDLEQTADELRETVEQQSETIQQLMPSRPSRRSVLAAALGLGVGAGGVYSATDRAAAQAAGQVGTSSNPVDAFTYDLDVQNGASFNGSDLTNVGAADIDSLSLTAVQSADVTFSSNETKSNLLIPIGSSDVETVDSIIPFARPVPGSGNDHGYEINKLNYDSSNDNFRLEITETEGDGGGDCRFGAFVINSN